MLFQRVGAAAEKILLLIQTHLVFLYILTVIIHTSTAKHSKFTLFTVLYAINQHMYNKIPSHIQIFFNDLLKSLEHKATLIPF